MSLVTAWVRSRAKARTPGPKNQCRTGPPASRRFTVLTTQPFLHSPSCTAPAHELSQETVDIADGHVKTGKVTALWAPVPK